MIHVPDAVWYDIVEFLWDSADIRDCDDGPCPNRAMSLLAELEYLHALPTPVKKPT